MCWLNATLTRVGGDAAVEGARVGAAAAQAILSRIDGGIHFEFDTLASFGVCVPLADYAFANYLRPRFPSQ